MTRKWISKLGFVKGFVKGFEMNMFILH